MSRSRTARSAGAIPRWCARRFRRLNQPLEIVSLPWARCLADVGSGDQDGAYPASWLPDRAALALYPTVPLGELSYVFATTRAGAVGWEPSHKPSLLPQPIAVPHGFSILAALHRLDGIQIVDHLATDEADLVALLHGAGRRHRDRVEVARYIVQRDGVADKIAILEPPLVTGQKYYLMVSKRYAAGSMRRSPSPTASPLRCARSRRLPPRNLSGNPRPARRSRRT